MYSDEQINRRMTAEMLSRHHQYHEILDAAGVTHTRINWAHLPPFVTLWWWGDSRRLLTLSIHKDGAALLAMAHDGRQFVDNHLTQESLRSLPEAYPTLPDAAALDIFLRTVARALHEHRGKLGQRPAWFDLPSVPYGDVFEAAAQDG